MKYELDDEEKVIEKEAKNYQEVSEHEKLRIERILEKNAKDRIITLRLNSFVLEQIKSIAKSEGMPYQTLISSILHKYINNRFVDKKEVLKISELLK